MLSQGNLIIAIVVPIVIPIGLAMFIFFFALQYKYLKRVRARLEWQEQSARTRQVRRTGLSKYDILHYCPLLIYKGTTKASLHPNKQVIGRTVYKEEELEALSVDNKDARGSGEGFKTEAKAAHKKEEEGDAFVISVVNPGNSEWFAREGDEDSKKKQLDENPPLLSAKSIPGGVCSICLEEVKKESRIRLLRCGHAFHMRCIERWLGSVNRCPLCNLSAADRPTTICVSQPSYAEQVALPIPESSPPIERGNIFQRIGHWFREAFSDVPPELRNVAYANGPREPPVGFHGANSVVTEEDEERGWSSEEGRLSSMYRDEDQHANVCREDIHRVVESHQM